MLTYDTNDTVDYEVPPDTMQRLFEANLAAVRAQRQPPVIVQPEVVAPEVVEPEEPAKRKRKKKLSQRERKRAQRLKALLAAEDALANV